MTGLTINHDLCCHCGACIESCPFSALREEEGRVVAGAECRLCRSCVAVCPVSALTVEEGENRTDRSGCRGVSWENHDVTVCGDDECGYGDRCVGASNCGHVTAQQ